MAPGRRSFLSLISIFVIVLGLGCLNYTQFEGVEHHRDWAQKNGMPAPSESIFYAGAAASVLGGIALGFAFARRKTS